MKIQLIKEKNEPSRMSTILSIIVDNLENNGYVVREVSHIKGFIKLDPDRGIIK